METVLTKGAARTRVPNGSLVPITTKVRTVFQRARIDIAIRECQVGTTEFVQMIDNWRELLRLQIMHQQLEARMRQTLASLERVVGGYTVYSIEAIPAPDTDPIPLPTPP